MSGSVITAGQSGVQWGYRLLRLQFLLMPILYIVQELDGPARHLHRPRPWRADPRHVRPVLGLAVRAGLGIATMGALLTEFSGVAGVGELYGLPRAVTLPVAAVGLLAVVITGSYRALERVAIMVGLFELAFFFVAWAARPNAALLLGASRIPYADKRLPLSGRGQYRLGGDAVDDLLSAVGHRRQKLASRALTAARWDTAIGAVVTQLVMAAVLIACAATIGGKPLAHR